MTLDFKQGLLEKLDQGTLQSLAPEDTFQFSCGDECMGRCCNNITIYLDPWDVEVMAGHLNLPGQDFFNQYCAMDFDSRVGWPLVWLAHAAQGPCFFMEEDGKCSIYPARSRNCRTYPLGRAVRYLPGKDGKNMEEVVFMVDRMEFCLGHVSGRSWTVREWFEDAGANTFYRMSDQYTELVDYAVTDLESRRWLSEKSVQMIFPFLYAPDLIRSKIGINAEDVGHEEFHRRRMAAVKLILTDLAGGFGFGPRAGQVDGSIDGSMMERVKGILVKSGR